MTINQSELNAIEAVKEHRNLAAYLGCHSQVERLNEMMLELIEITRVMHFYSQKLKVPVMSDAD